MNPRKAILTGSTKYSEAPLKFPKKDIDLIAKVLEKRCRFKKNDINKILHTDKSEDSSYIKKIEDVCKKLNSDRTNSYDLVIFYYSGHGVYKSSEQMSFLEISDNEYIPIDEIIKLIPEVKAKNKYFIIDACQSGGFSLMTPKNRKVERQYRHNSEGIYCMFGTTKHQLAFEPTTKDIIRRKVNNSFYTHFIAEALNTQSNYHDDTISIRVVDDYACKKTPTYTNFEQIPFSTTQTTGYFPFGFWEEKKELKDIVEWNAKQKEQIQYSSNQEIDNVRYLITKIRLLFTEDNYFLFNADIEMLSQLSQPAKDYLNEELDLVNKKFNNKPLVNGLISASNKYSFLIFILEHQEIAIDLTLKDNDVNTVLYEVIHNSSNHIIRLLFSRGYKLDKDEKNALVSQFNNNQTRPDILENITIALICHKLKSKELILKLQFVERILFTFLSFKLNKVIGYKLNYTALANNLLQHHKDFSGLFLKALKKYKHYEKLKTKASFIKKEQQIREEMPFQETKYDEVFAILFPELFAE